MIVAARERIAAYDTDETLLPKSDMPEFREELAEGLESKS